MQDAQFIEAFKNQFSNDVLKYNKHYLKELQSQYNPLFHLINIDKQQNRQNTLVKDLIGLATTLIEVRKDDILYETFYRPSRQNFTYAILFDKSFNSFPIYTQLINHLNGQWKQWIAEGILASDVLTWKGFSREQQVIVREIWTLVTQATKEKLKIDAVFDANDRAMQAQLEMKEKIVTCLNAYCQHATDKDLYHQQVREWHQRLEREIIKSIQIPKTLQDIVPFAEKLNPYANAHSWQVFLKQRGLINSSKF